MFLTLIFIFLMMISVSFLLIKSDLEIAKTMSLLNNSGLYIFNSFNKILNLCEISCSEEITKEVKNFQYVLKNNDPILSIDAPSIIPGISAITKDL